MNVITRTVIGVTGTVALAGLALGARRALSDRRMRRIEQALRIEATTQRFDEDLLKDLPEPVQRYFRHAIRPGTPLAQSVELQISGRMKPREDAGFVDLTADEVLTPPHGFVWTARLTVGPVPLRVRDHYAGGDGAVDITALELIPAGRETGPEVARSSRHRLAGEAVWLPASLLPQRGVAWEAIDEEHARATLTIDGETIPLTLTIDEEGRLREIRMTRYGNVGVPAWQLIPYGFTVEEEQTSDGFTIPTAIRGGWWYGTERYDPKEAAYFHVDKARFFE